VAPAASGAGAGGPAREGADPLSILRARCGACHGASSAKAGLALHEPAAIRRGSKRGPVLSAESPESSELLRRIERPADAKGHMPPPAKPQPTAGELAALRAWVLAGAPMGGGAGAKASSPLDAPHADPLPPPADERALAALASAFVHAAPLEQGSPLLEVDFAAAAPRTGDAEARALLAPLRAQVAVLSLARSRITGSLGPLLASMPRLRRLDLRSTAFGDAGLEALRGHAALEELVLSLTPATDHGVDAILSMPALQSVRLAGSAVTAAGLARIREERPSIDAEAAWDGTPAALEVEPPPRLSRGESPEPAPGAAAPPPVNASCPVSGKPVDPAYSIVFEGRVVGFCCSGCPPKFWASPADYRAKLP
jgi:hypothetical protein